MGEFLLPMVGGLSQLADPLTWAFVLLGTLYGVAAGAMPGVGATLAYGLVLPFTFAMSPVHAVAFLLAISVGVQYGNSIPAILMGIPGNPAAILTVIDGHKLHKRGEGGLALGIAFVAALGGQFVSILMFILLIVPLMGLAYSFLYSEIFSLYFLGMVAIISLTGKNVIKGLMAAAFGLAIGLVGLDPMNLTTRFDFGFREIRSGFNEVAVVIGLLAVSELFRSARQVFQWQDLSGEVTTAKFPPWRRIRPTIPAMFGGTVIGTLVGAIPGAGATPAAMISYQQAQLVSKRPQEFGDGSTEGIAANEAAQNASNAGELIPTLGLGVPGSGSMVLLLTALTVHGFVPGPLMISSAPDLFHAAIAGMLAATLFLVLTGWRMAATMLKAVNLNRQVVIVLALAMVALGTYSLSTRVLDVAVAMVAGGIGYFMLRYGYSTAAAALAVYLGSEFERNLRIGLNFVDNSFVGFFSRPITATIMAVSLAILAYGVYRELRFRREVKQRETAIAARAASARPVGRL
jgi:putative tricarboxylic transport membrane protein